MRSQCRTCDQSRITHTHIDLRISIRGVLTWESSPGESGVQFIKHTLIIAAMDHPTSDSKDWIWKIEKKHRRKTNTQQRQKKHWRAPFRVCACAYVPLYFQEICRFFVLLLLSFIYHKLCIERRSDWLFISVLNPIRCVWFA